jgi:hypothetical protein
VPRGVLLTVLSATLTIAAHGMAGGGLPDGADQLLFTGLLTALFTWGARSATGRGGTVRLFGVLAATQAAQHVLLTQLAGHGSHGPAPVDGRVMLATHAVAILLTAVLFTRADTALGAVGTAIAWLLRGLTVNRTLSPAPAGRAATSPVPARPGELLEVLLRRVSQRRGPPARS